MDNTLFGSLIQRAHSSDNSSFGFCQIVTFHGSPGIPNSHTGLTAVYAVADTAFFVLLVALDLRFDVCQGLSPKKH
jgi:hypothetical protein